MERQDRAHRAHGGTTLQPGIYARAATHAMLPLAHGAVLGQSSADDQSRHTPRGNCFSEPSVTGLRVRQVSLMFTEEGNTAIKVSQPAGQGGGQGGGRARSHAVHGACCSTLVHWSSATRLLCVAVSEVSACLLRLHVHACVQIEGGSPSALVQLVNKGPSLDGFHVHQDKNYVVTVVMRAPNVSLLPCASLLACTSPK